LREKVNKVGKGTKPSVHEKKKRRGENNGPRAGKGKKGD